LPARLAGAVGVSVSAQQRFTPAHPCPVCGGNAQQPQGQGRRCWGFLSEDGEYAHCERDDHANGIEAGKDGAYAHRLHGSCKCGKEHGPRKGESDGHNGFVIAKSYDYVDGDGQLLFQTVRLLPKDFRQRRPNGTGGWTWKLNGAKPILYRLPELLATPIEEDHWIFLPEGEKDADNLYALGFVATTTAMGASNWHRTDLEPLTGHRVVIVEDNDVDGRKRTEGLGRQLAVSAAEVRVLRFPSLPEHGDVSDWLEAGGTATELREMTLAAPQWKASANGQAEQTGRICVRRLTDLRQLPDAEVEWIVERFAASGSITDLVAYIKTGKTSLAAQLLAAVLHDERFLGRFAVLRSAAVLLTEERPASLLAALDDAGLTDDDDLHVLLWTEQTGVTWPEIVAQANELCRLVGARLLVVDTLGMWAGVDDENAAGEARAAMAPLMQIASGLAILVLRQSRKEAAGIHNAGRGSGAYGGAADILVHLDYTRDEKGKVLEESTKRWLGVKSRLERDQVPSMQLDYADGKYVALDFTPVDVRARRAIMADLKTYGASRPVEVAKRTGIKRNTVSVTLSRMDGLVIEASGLYSLTGAAEALAGNGDKTGDTTVTPVTLGPATGDGDKTSPPTGGREGLVSPPLPGVTGSEGVA